MGGTLPWGLIFCGIGVAVVIELLGIPVLPFAIGLYLPLYLTAPIFVGGIIRWFVEKRKAKEGEEEVKEAVNNGTLFCSGMIAGEGLIGILLAVFAVIKVGDKSIGDIINLGGPLGNIGGALFFVIIIAAMLFFSLKKSKKVTA